MFVKDAITEIVNSIKNNTNFRNHSNLVLVGLSASGKSKMLRDIIKGLICDNIYFIDSPNRIIKSDSNSNSTLKTFGKIDVKDVLECRISAKNMGGKDTFSANYSTEVVLNEILINKEIYRKLFLEVLNKELTFGDLEFSDAVEILESFKLGNDLLGNICSGYQAQMRMLMEIDFAVKSKCTTIIIDEYDAHLDYKDSKNFLDNIIKKYNETRFIIVIHSAYTLIELENFDVLKIIKEYDDIDNNLCVFYDSNDLYELASIHSKIFDNELVKYKADMIFADALSEKICKGDVSNNFFMEIGKLERLSVRQKVLLEYIKGCN